MVNFKCFHCGACCKFQSTQINLTLGDIARISKLLNVKPSKLIIEEYFEPAPFLNPASPFQADIELGLHKPCKFWKNDRCSVYEARPLNCRLFPVWMFAKLPPEEIKKQAVEGYECVEKTILAKEDIPVYNKYTDAVGKILMQESGLTEEFIRKNGLDKKLAIIEYKDVIFDENISPDDKMDFLIKKMKEKNFDFKNLPLLLDEELKDVDLNLEKLKEIEKILV